MILPQDPFYVVKEEIQESIDKLQSKFHHWESVPLNTLENILLTKELLASCEGIEWQVDELDKTIEVAVNDPSRYGLDEIELARRKRWTASAHNQVANVEKAISDNSGSNGMERDPLRPSNGDNSHLGSSNFYSAQSSESEKEQLLIKRQDHELEEIRASVQRTGDVGLTIKEELTGQWNIMDDIEADMNTTSSGLEFAKIKAATVMNKAGAKQKIMMVALLVAVLVILFTLLFFT